MCVLKTIQVTDQQPLGTMRAVMQSVWEAAPLSALLIPIWSEDDQLPIPTLIRDPELLSQADPFAPVMPGNAARLAVDEMNSHTGGTLGLCLRPCEMRSLKQIAASENLCLDEVLLISSDCLGAIPAADYRRHLTLMTDHSQMTRETLHFAAQGGILPSRYQQACQLCDAPYPEQVDLFLQLFGYETQKQIALGWHEEKFASPLEEQLSLFDIPPGIEARRSRVLANLARWRNKSLEERQDILDPEYATPAALLSHLEHCSYCWDILETHCPTFDLPDQQVEDEQDLLRWLNTCGGCGMCDCVCPTGYPLLEVILTIRQAGLFI
jgi:Pyruvate/2-oxoacid:ferredoxin oxidoreductase delta subunit